MGIEDFLKFAPKEWREEFEAAASVPIKGPIQDTHGVVHEIFGNHTACGKPWAGQTRFGRVQANAGWTMVPEDTAFTCFACLRDIHLPEG